MRNIHMYMRSLVPQIRVVVVPRNDCEEEEHEMGPKQISISGVICNTTRTRAGTNMILPGLLIVSGSEIKRPTSICC